MRAPIAVITVALPLLLGCRSTYSEKAAATFNERRLRLEGWLYDNTVWPLCNNENSAPSTMITIERNSRSTHPVACGMIANEISTPSFVAQFVQQVCGGTDNIECGDRYRQMFIARLAERYNLADFGVLANRCAAHPIDCAKTTTVELWTIELHNNAARASYDEAFRSATDDYEQQQAAYAAKVRADRAELVRQLSHAYTPPTTVNCSSMTIGNMTSTTCQ